MSLYFKKGKGIVSGGTEGFTLAELIITMGIAMLILTVVVLNQSNYTEAAALGNLADEISLSISEAQAYGVGVKELSIGSADFSAAYGLSFNIDADGSPAAYIFFADRGAKNQKYDGDWSCPTGGASECLSKVNISRRNTISAIKVLRTCGVNLCEKDSAGRVDISFERPETEARVKFFSNGGNPFTPANIIGAEITLTSPKGLTRTVTVYNTGQISAQ